ncbi:hypothetical protein C1Y40_00762 [Mycobacterium talmoniae]|uniref:Uncharacterized protein n=1 Tax=Mycobacterium talmoniae TaxID=1858794 RepID=A0A2S8BQW6_9MYCO|nr:hypothetical protein C1Y40_00762 [Mycobacterium talmoniae]
MGGEGLPLKGAASPEKTVTGSGDPVTYRGISRFARRPSAKLQDAAAGALVRALLTPPLHSRDHSVM